MAGNKITNLFWGVLQSFCYMEYEDNIETDPKKYSLYWIAVNWFNICH